MLGKMLRSYFKSALFSILFLISLCSFINANDKNMPSAEFVSVEKELTEQITKTELDFNSVGNANLNFLAIGSDISQVTFYAGYQCPPPRACNINQLKITGVGGDGRTGSWTSSWFNPPVYSMPNNWWWRPDRGIKLDFSISGYGWKNCYVKMSRPWWGFPSRVHIIYTGNNTCKFQ